MPFDHGLFFRIEPPRWMIRILGALAPFSKWWPQELGLWSPPSSVSPREMGRGQLGVDVG